MISFDEIPKIIEELQHLNDDDKDKVKNHERIYRSLTENDTFYKRSHRRQIDMANARIETRLYVIERLKKWILIKEMLLL